MHSLTRRFLLLAVALLLPLQGFAAALPFCVSTVHPAHHEASGAGAHDHADAPADAAVAADDVGGSGGSSHNHDLCFSAALSAPAAQFSFVSDGTFSGTVPASTLDHVPPYPKRPPLA